MKVGKWVVAIFNQEGTVEDAYLFEDKLQAEDIANEALSEIVGNSGSYSQLRAQAKNRGLGDVMIFFADEIQKPNPQPISPKSRREPSLPPYIFEPTSPRSPLPIISRTSSEMSPSYGSPPPMQQRNITPYHIEPSRTPGNTTRQQIVTPQAPRVTRSTNRLTNDARGTTNTQRRITFDDEPNVITFDD